MQLSSGVCDWKPSVVLSAVMIVFVMLLARESELLSGHNSWWWMALQLQPVGFLLIFIAREVPAMEEHSASKFLARVILSASWGTFMGDFPSGSAPTWIEALLLFGFHNRIITKAIIDVESRPDFDLICLHWSRSLKICKTRQWNRLKPQ